MQDLQTLFTEAVDLHQRKMFAEAEMLYLQVHNLLPENVNVLANLGIISLDLGKLDQAEEYCRKILSVSPDDPASFLNLGAVLEARNDLAGAKILYEKALKIAPYHPKILNNYGKLLHQLGLSLQGVELLERALKIEPDYPLALNNLGVIYSELGALEKAGRFLEKSVNLDPQNVNSLYNLAGVYNGQNDHLKAKIVLNRLLTIDNDHQSARHMLSALSGDTPNSAPRQYVEEVFNKYAHRFDDHLEKSLGYTAPSVLGEMLRKAAKKRFPLSSALDLGCGTGLSGAKFRGITERLVGVDVSALMLEKARKKNIYDCLERIDILEYLQEDGEKFDLFIAADVLVYLGDPKPLFLAIRTRSKDGGIVALSIEQTLQLDGFKLLPSGRYAHNPQFLQECAKEVGFSVFDHKPHNIRKENGQWLPGDLYLFVKND